MYFIYNKGMNTTKKVIKELMLELIHWTSLINVLDIID